jgi:hypothetical protein
MRSVRRRSLAIGLAAGLIAVLAATFALQRVEHTSVPSTLTAERAGSEAFVFAEERPDSTTFWLADSQNPSVRQRLLSVTRETGRSGEASLSADGHWLAYTRLPAGVPDADHSAELWVLRIGGGARRLETGVDLLSFLVWSPDNGSVTFERVTDAGVELWRRSVSSVAAELLQPAAPSQVYVPIGYDREGTSLLAARVSSAGTDIVSFGEGGARLVVPAGAGAGRDFSLSADRSRLAFLTVGPSANDRYTAEAVDLAGSSVTPLAAAGAEDVGLAWRPDNALTIGGVGEASRLRSSDGSAAPLWQQAGFLQPLAWSPSGTLLAVRAFAGANPENPGAARDLLLAADGRPRSITAVDPVRFVGWVSR